MKYTRIDIKSEADLPKEEDFYPVQRKDGVVDWEIWEPSKDKGYKDLWLRTIDWYLLPDEPCGQVGEEDFKPLHDGEKYALHWKELFDDLKMTEEQISEIELAYARGYNACRFESKQDKGAEEKTERQIIMEILNCYRDEVDNYDCKFIPDYKFNSVALDILNELQSCFKEKRKEELISYHEWLEDEFENPVYNRRYINEYLNSK